MQLCFLIGGVLNLRIVMTSKKIIISNYSQLKAKYNSSLSKILDGLNLLVESDEKRGISSKIVFVDKDIMQKDYGVSPVSNYKNEEQNKVAIDAIYNGENKPDYLMILGAIDVIPHQNLTNPVDENEKLVPSDLPYACNNSYSQNIYDFLGPSRIVGRLPDVTGGANPDYLLELINYIIDFKPYDKEYYLNYLGACSSQFIDTTKVSINNIFNNTDSIIESPPANSQTLEKYIYNNPAQFYNCHGNSQLPFWGEPTETGKLIFLLISSMLDKKFSPNTVVVSEACYGAELYDPSGAILPEAKSILPICNNMLKHGVVGFFGSTDTLYGEIEDGHQKQGDLITSFYLDNVVNGGCSLGRAVVEAQHKFLKTCKNALSPFDLKTIAQCILLGDPSLHLASNLSIITEHKGLFLARRERRDQFKLTSDELNNYIFYNAENTKEIPASINEMVQKLIVKYNLKDCKITRYVKYRRNLKNKEGIEKIDSDMIFYVVRGMYFNKYKVYKEAALHIEIKSDKVINEKLCIKK